MHAILDLYLHDAKLSTITCHYLDHRVEIPLKLGHRCGDAVLNFEGVSHIDITLCEPWGAGGYISEVLVSDSTEKSVSQDGAGGFLTTILLNSGDNIRLRAERLTYSD